MTQITLTFRTVDGAVARHTYRDLTRARRAAHERVGTTPELGMTYAISGDGIVRVSVDVGCHLHDLFPALRAEAEVTGDALPFQVWVASVDEDAGTTSWYCAAEKAVFADALAALEELAAQADGVELRGVTDAARLTIIGHREKLAAETAAVEEPF